jgi:chemotaxis protein histidine kinase CheA
MDQSDSLELENFKKEMVKLARERKRAEKKYSDIRRGLSIDDVGPGAPMSNYKKATVTSDVDDDETKVGGPTISYREFKLKQKAEAKELEQAFSKVVDKERLAAKKRAEQLNQIRQAKEEEELKEQEELKALQAQKKEERKLERLRNEVLLYQARETIEKQRKEAEAQELKERVRRELINEQAQRETRTRELREEYVMRTRKLLESKFPDPAKVEELVKTLEMGWQPPSELLQPSIPLPVIGDRPDETSSMEGMASQTSQSGSATRKPGRRRYAKYSIPNP